jgi:hypothetical protein
MIDHRDAVLRRSRDNLRFCVTAPSGTVGNTNHGRSVALISPVLASVREPLLRKGHEQAPNGLSAIAVSPHEPFDPSVRETEMKRSAPTALVTAIFLALLILPANAQATRTWVSGVGDDVNPCSRTAPCKTFAGAISKTAVSGVINCLDPGGFGGVTITKSITIDCEEGTAGVLVAGTNAINVSGGGIVVNLRGLDIEGVGAGVIGINILQAGAVYIRKSVIYGFTNGINFTGGGTLVVDDCVVHSNASNGILVNGGGSGVNATLRNVVAHGNAASGIVVASGGALIERSTMASNGTGLNLSGGIAMIGNSTITGNTTGVAASAGTFFSFKQNQIGGNTADGTPITPFPGPGGPLQ